MLIEGTVSVIFRICADEGFQISQCEKSGLDKIGALTPTIGFPVDFVE